MSPLFPAGKVSGSRVSGLKGACGAAARSLRDP